jgi:hypothetical protein
VLRANQRLIQKARIRQAWGELTQHIAAVAQAKIDLLRAPADLELFSFDLLQAILHSVCEFTRVGRSKKTPIPGQDPDGPDTVPKPSLMRPSPFDFRQERIRPAFQTIDLPLAGGSAHHGPLGVARQAPTVPTLTSSAAG